MNIQSRFIKILSILQWLVLSGTIYYFSSQSKIDFLPSEIWNFDKVVHFFIFLLYGLSAGFMFYVNYARRNKLLTILIMTLFLGTLFGGLDEFHQSFVPGRTPDIYDFTADFLGVLSSIILFRYILKKINLKKKEN